MDATQDNAKLNDDEVVNIVMEILLTGFDTTANSLALISYHLALNPDVQEKLQQEITSYFEENPVRFAIITFCDVILNEFRRHHTMKQCQKLST